MEIEGDLPGSTAADHGDGEGDSEGGIMEVHLDDPSEQSEDMGMESEAEAGPSNPGKRVKVRHTNNKDRLVRKSRKLIK